jgi:2-aminobenzoate-CoA ligase
MGIISIDYLPPKDSLPDKIFPLPEVRFPQKLNLGERFLDRHITEGRGSKVALLYEERKITFSELQKEVNRFANALLSIGVEKNDRVLLRSPNRPEFIVATFASWKIGAIPVLVHHLLKAEEIAFRARDTEAKAILVSSDTFSEVEKAIPQFPDGCQVIIFGDRMKGYVFYEDLIRNQPDQIQVAETTKNDWGRIIYSSGTTGRPKGILNTVGDLAAAITIANRSLLQLTPGDVLGGHPGFTFAFGFFSILFFGYSGCTFSIIDRFSPESMFETIERHGITVLRCVPTVYRMMLEVKDAEKRFNLRSLRLCQSAGEWLPGATVKEWKKRFGIEILDSIGSGEWHSILSTRVGTPEEKLDSSGLPLPGIDCRIVDENFDELPRGEFGELVLRAPWGIQYWRRPDLQKKSIRNGWNRTGLIFAEDPEGYFWLKGRDDDMIVSAGYKIPAGEVETALLSHKAVLEAIAIPSPDPIRGNIVKTYIVLNQGFQPSDQLAEELKNFVKERIEPYKYPREIIFVDGKSLPRTTTGKVKRFLLREEEKEKKDSA